MVTRKPYFQSQIHTYATFHVSRAIPLWYLSPSGQEKTVLSIANSHQCNIPRFSGHFSMVFECLWSRENRTFNRKFTPMQHPMSLRPFQYRIRVLLVKRKPYFQSQIHTNATSHLSRAIPVWYLSPCGHEKTVLSIANSHLCNIPCLSGHSTMVFECFWSRENRTFNRKFTPMQHPMSCGPFQYGI